MSKETVCPGNTFLRNIAAGSAGSLMILLAAIAILIVPASVCAEIHTERVNVGSAGEQTSHSSSSSAFPQAVSADGRYVLFKSHCNLGELDYFAYGYVYLRDRSTGETTPVNLTADGMPFICASPALSDNGRYVVFISDRNYFPDYFVDDEGTVITGGGIFRLDLITGQIIRVDLDNDGNPAVGYWESPGHSVYAGPSYPAVSADGRYVAFRSWATNLAEGQNPEVADIFLRDTQEGTTELVTFGIDGPAGHIIYNNGSYYDCHSAPAVSADGRYVAFSSVADDLVASDSNGEEEDVFVYDRNAGPGNKITLVSVHSDGTQGRQPMRYEELPIPAVSAEGHVVFESRAENLVNGDNNDYGDVFVHDISTGETMLASRANTGGSCNGGARRPDISADGRYVVFESSANDLVPGDNNGLPGQPKGIDIFRFDRTTGEMTLMSRAGDGTQGNNGSGLASMSIDGRYVAYSSYASNLVPGDTNGQQDAFISWYETRFTLTVTREGTGSGTVTSDPEGIDCGEDCSEAYPDQTVVTLTPAPDPGSVFAGWGGDCADGQVTMTSDKTCTAEFRAVNLTDAVTGLQILVGLPPVDGNAVIADVNADGNIGLPEVIHILETIADLR